MQQHEQERHPGEGRQHDNWLRQKRFALILSGDNHAANMLVERLSLGGEHASNADQSSSAFEYFQLKKLYELWINEAKGAPQKVQLFQPGNENEAIQKGLDPSLAKIMGELPTLHRALLLLIYGEKFSYAATAQLLDISIEVLMGALASAQSQFSDGATFEIGPRAASMRAPHVEAVHDAT